MQKSLIIKGSKTQISRTQQTFNNLIKKIEKLQNAIQKNTSILDEKMKFYNTEMVKPEAELLNTKKEITLLLYKVFKSKQYKGRERTLLKLIISSYLNEIMESEELSEDLQAVFKGVEKMDYQEMKDNEFRFKKEALEQMFGFYGFDINANAFSAATSEEDLMKETFKMMNDFENNAASFEKSQPRKKTKKQLEKELKQQEKEELRNKDIGKVYKQLAKIFHPDLETDAGKRLEKEELMKRLTIAYENKDLHTLLRLELEYIYKEENDTANLSEEKLKIYNEVLRDQIFELEKELYSIPMHPQYSALQLFVQRPQDLVKLNLNGKKRILERELTVSKAAVVKLNGTTVDVESQIRKMFYEYENMEREESFFFD